MTRPALPHSRPGRPEAIVVVQCFIKQTHITPRNVIATCRERLKAHDLLAREREEDR